MSVAVDEENELLRKALNPVQFTGRYEAQIAKKLRKRGLLRTCQYTHDVTTDEGRARLGLPPVPGLPVRMTLRVIDGGKVA